MPRGRRSSAAGTPAAQTPKQESVAAFLRELARRAEDDPAFAARLDDALRASGLLPAQAERSRVTKAIRGERGQSTERAPDQGRIRRTPARAASASAPPPLDPYAALRVSGPDGLRAALQPLDLAALRAIVRSCRFDPARISARWTARERLVEFIVAQTQARADHGKAFSRV